MSKSDYHLNAFLSICNNEYGGRYEDIPKDYCLEYLAASKNPLCINSELQLSVLKDTSLATIFLFNSMVVSNIESVFFDYLSKQDLATLSLREKDKRLLVANIFDEYATGNLNLEHVTRFLSAGIEFKQSEKVGSLEFDMMDSGNIKFFRFLKQNSEFDFNKKYIEVDGSRIGMESYMEELKLDKKFPELYFYIKKIQHVDSLDSSLDKVDYSSKPKMKI